MVGIPSEVGSAAGTSAGLSRTDLCPRPRLVLCSEEIKIQSVSADTWSWRKARDCAWQGSVPAPLALRSWSLLRRVLAPLLPTPAVPRTGAAAPNWVQHRTRATPPPGTAAGRAGSCPPQAHPLASSGLAQFATAHFSPQPLPTCLGPPDGPLCPVHLPRPRCLLC